MTNEEQANALSMTQEMLKRGIPVGLHSGVILFHLKGIKPGDFLTAVLSNDLLKAVSYGDKENLDALPALVKFLYNKCPGSMFGSPARVAAWEGCEYFGDR